MVKSFFENKVTFLLLLSVLSCSCQNQATNQIKKTDNIKDIKNVTPVVLTTNNTVKNEIVNPTKIETIVEGKEDKTPDEDEKSIIDLVNSNIELFPSDSQSEEEINQATVLNNGGVVFATVLNNGGVVFASDDTNSFTTKALLDDKKQKLIDTIENNKTENKNNDNRNNDNKNQTNSNSDNKNRPILDTIKNKVAQQVKNKAVVKLPEQWVRKIVGKPQRKLKVVFNKEKTQADVIVTTVITREILKFNQNIPSKQFKEESQTKSTFIKEGKIWKIQKVSPTKQISSEKETIEIQEVKFTIASKNKDGNIETKNLVVELNEAKDKNDLISFSKGDIVTIEVKAFNKDNPELPLNVFARLGTTSRIPLFDDGSQENISNSNTSGDKIKDDDIYTTNVLIKNKLGFNTLNITAINGNSFNKDESYLAVSRTIPINIK